MDDGWQHRRDEKHDATPSRRSLPLPWTWPSPRRERCDAASPRRVVDTISWLRDGLAERHGAFKIAANPLRWPKLVIVATAAAVAAALGEGPRQHLAAQIAQTQRPSRRGRACVRGLWQPLLHNSCDRQFQHSDGPCRRVSGSKDDPSVARPACTLRSTLAPSHRSKCTPYGEAT